MICDELPNKELEMSIKEKMSLEWRSIRIEKLSEMTMINSLEHNAQELIDMSKVDGALIKDAGLAIWRAKVGRGAVWQYSTDYEAAVMLAMQNASTTRK
jgi:hypothetical protein